MSHTGSLCRARLVLSRPLIALPAPLTLPASGTFCSKHMLLSHACMTLEGRFRPVITLLLCSGACCMHDQLAHQLVPSSTLWSTYYAIPLLALIPVLVVGELAALMSA